jgi:hypothetical protein
LNASNLREISILSELFKFNLSRIADVQRGAAVGRGTEENGGLQMQAPGRTFFRR